MGNGGHRTSRKKKKSMESNEAEVPRVVGTEETLLELTIRGSQVAIQRKGRQKLDFQDL